MICRGAINGKFFNKPFVAYKSGFVHRQNPFLQLGPFKIQILSSTPIKVIIFDVFYDHDAEWMISTAKERLEQKKDQIVHPDMFGSQGVSSQSSAVTLELELPRGTPTWTKIVKTYDRITLATGLFTRPPFASETLRVSAYGVSGTERYNIILISLRD